MSRQFCKYLILSLLFLVSCRSGATLRTARTLPPGCREIGLGAVSSLCVFVVPSPVLSVAVGLTPRLELEARAEWDYLALSPRFQLLSHECQGIDAVVFGEAGVIVMDEAQGGGLFGAGMVVGRQLGPWDPYVSYRYRYATIGQNWDILEEKQGRLIRPDQGHHSHHGRLGIRYTFCSAYFFGVEGGGAYVSNVGFMPELGLNMGRIF